MVSFCYFYVCFIQKTFNFFVSLFKDLLEPTFPSFLIILDMLYDEVFGCSIVTGFISTIFGLSKVFV